VPQQPTALARQIAIHAASCSLRFVIAIFLAQTSSVFEAQRATQG
jgi:hypothetical protein